MDAAIQVLALVAPHPSQGMGVVAFALLPAILVYHALLVAGVIAGIGLAVICFWRAGGALMTTGVALLVLTAANGHSMIQEQRATQSSESRQSAQATAFDVAVAKCADVMALHARDATAYFSAPRTVVAMAGPYAVAFGNGMRVQLPPADAPQPFQEFFYDHLAGATVRVALRPPSAEWLSAWCRMAGAAAPAGHTLPYEGDVHLANRKIDAAAYQDAAFPRPASTGGATPAPGLHIGRWRDPHSGDRTYAAAGTLPARGYIADGPGFAVAASPSGESAVALYLCNFPLQRPSSPEHFLSTDAACEGQEGHGLLGYVSARRDGLTPRALIRCLGTVQSPLRTGPRHLIGTDVRECRGHDIESVLGYVEG